MSDSGPFNEGIVKESGHGAEKGFLLLSHHAQSGFARTPEHALNPHRTESVHHVLSQSGNGGEGWGEENGVEDGREIGSGRKDAEEGEEEDKDEVRDGGKIKGEAITIFRQGV